MTSWSDSLRRRAQRPQVTIPWQQRIALSRSAVPTEFVMVHVVRELPLVGHELVPTMSAGWASWRQIDHSAGATATVLIRPPPAVDVSAGIGGVLQYLQDAGAVRRAPDYLVWRRPAQRPHPQQQIAPPQISHYRLGTVQFAKLREYQVHSRCCTSSSGLNVTVPSRVLHEPRRKQHPHQPPRSASGTAPLAARGAGFSEIVIDDVNPLARPAEQYGALDQPILQLRAFLVVTDLPRPGDAVRDRRKLSVPDPSTCTLG